MGVTNDCVDQARRARCAEARKGEGTLLLQFYLFEFLKN